MDLSEIVATYGSAWNETDESKRAALLEQAFAADGTYQDPMGAANSRDELVAHIAGFHAMMPGQVIDQASAVDAHGDVFRFAWVMRDGAEVTLEGMDFGEVAPDGRIRRIVGFFGPFPPMEG